MRNMRPGKLGLPGFIYVNGVGGVSKSPIRPLFIGVISLRI